MSEPSFFNNAIIDRIDISHKVLSRGANAFGFSEPFEGVTRAVTNIKYDVWDEVHASIIRACQPEEGNNE